MEAGVHAWLDNASYRIVPVRRIAPAQHTFAPAQHTALYRLDVSYRLDVLYLIALGGVLGILFGIVRMIRASLSNDRTTCLSASSTVMH